MENQPLNAIRSWFRRASSVAGTEAAQEKTTEPVPKSAPAGPQTSPPIQSPIPRSPVERTLTTAIEAPPTQPPPQQQETPQSPAQPQPPSPLQQQEQEMSLMSTANGASPESQQASPPPPSPPTTPKASRSHMAQPSPNPEPEPKPMIAPHPKNMENPEPEPQPTLEPQLKNVFMQPGSSNGSRKAVCYTDEESRVEGRATPLVPQNKPTTNETSATSRKKDDGELKVIIIAGENTGAYMELGTSCHQKQYHKEKQQNGSEQHHEKASESSNEEGRFTKKLEGKGGEGKAMAIVVNNNVQSVNNSILLSSSCNQHSPGVHIGLARQHRLNLSSGNASGAKRNQHFQ